MTTSEGKAEAFSELPNVEPVTEQLTPEPTKPEEQGFDASERTEFWRERFSEQFVEALLPESAPGPKPGFGTLSGACGVLDEDEWKSTKPFIFINTIDFGAMSFDSKKLSKGGQKIFSDGNLGGSSVHSEVFSFEVLHRCELASLLKTESEIQYKQSSGKKTDILLNIDGYKIGVSVTRAFEYSGKPYTMTNATKLLDKKLKDIGLSAANASPKDAWSRSILHILSFNKQHTDTVKAAYQKIDSKVKAKTILIVTTTEGTDRYIYTSRD